MFPKVNRGGDQPRIDTRYFDELFLKIKEEESEEFRDPEALGEQNITLFNWILREKEHNNKQLENSLMVTAFYSINLKLRNSLRKHSGANFRGRDRIKKMPK